MKALSLQGGGVLGYGQAILLSKIEQELQGGASIGSAFDFIAGTSVGSINGAIAAVGLPMRDLCKFYTEDAPKIFGSSRYWFQRLDGCAKYNANALESALRMRLGDHGLGDCKTKFLATAFEMNSRRMVFFQSYGASYDDEDEIVIGPDSDWRLAEVCRASAAAQTFFPAFEKDGMVFWDGGNTGANCPDTLLLDEISSDDSIEMMVSMGSGSTPWGFSGKELVWPSFVKALKATLNIAYGGPESLSVWSAQRRLGSRHKRFNPKLPDIAIDDASPTALSQISEAWSGISVDGLL